MAGFILVTESVSDNFATLVGNDLGRRLDKVNLLDKGIDRLGEILGLVLLFSENV